MDFAVSAFSQLLVAAEDFDGNTITKDNVSPGPIGFFVLLSLAIATFFLWRSMNRHLKRIDFGGDEDTEESVDIRTEASPGKE